jgi:hypothetical protein
LTLAQLALVGMYYRYHWRLLVAIRSGAKYRATACHALLLELLTLLIGVLPPGIEGSFSLSVTLRAEESGAESVERHVDAYCLLQLFRIPLLAKWLNVLVLPQVKSPAVLAWQHSMVVHTSFRMRFLFTRYPAKLVAVSLLCLLFWCARAARLPAPPQQQRRSHIPHVH